MNANTEQVLIMEMRRFIMSELLTWISLGLAVLRAIGHSKMNVWPYFLDTHLDLYPSGKLSDEIVITMRSPQSRKPGALEMCCVVLHRLPVPSLVW